MSSYTTTPRWQRIAIWIIAIATVGGTILGFVFMIWSTQNSKIDPNTIAQDKANEEYQKQLEEYQKQQEEARKNMRALDGYTDKVTAFNKDDVKELTVETLEEGDGATVADSSTLKVNYTGWTPDGKIFDSTKTEGSDATATTLSLSSVITGWKEGLTGKRAGGVYELSIPADKAYGSTGTSDGSIGANTPIKFIVEIIDVEK